MSTYPFPIAPSQIETFYKKYKNKPNNKIDKIFYDFQCEHSLQYREIFGLNDYYPFKMHPKPVVKIVSPLDSLYDLCSYYAVTEVKNGVAYGIALPEHSWTHWEQKYVKYVPKDLLKKLISDFKCGKLGNNLKLIEKELEISYDFK